MTLTIPKKDHERLAKLISLKPEQLEMLHDALQKAPPRIGSSQLVKDVAAIVPIDRRSLTDIIKLLFTLYAVQADRGLQPSEMAMELSRAAQETSDDRLRTPENSWNLLTPFVTRLLDLAGSLGLTAKATFVAYEYPSHFHGARVLTDARPVFPRDADRGPAAYMINHTLEISIHENGEERDIYLSLNARDLAELQSAIQRASAKEASLRASLQQTQLPVLDWGSNE
jgi:hypothetical protein